MRRWTFQLISQTRFHRTSIQRSIISESTRPTSRLTLYSSTSNTSTTTGSRRRLRLFSIIQAFRNNLVDEVELRLNSIKILRKLQRNLTDHELENIFLLERLNKTQHEHNLIFIFVFIWIAFCWDYTNFATNYCQFWFGRNGRKTYGKPISLQSNFHVFFFRYLAGFLFTNKKFFLFLGVATLEKCTNSQREGKASLYGVEHISAHFEYCPWMLWKIKFSNF